MHRNASFAIATCAFLLLAMPVSGAEDNSTGYEKGGFFHRIGVGITASDYAYYDKTYHFKSNCPANALEDKTKSADLIKAICKVNGGWREGDFFSTALNGGKDVMDRMAELLWIKEAMQKRLPQMKDSDEYLADLETKLKVDPKAKGVFKNLKDDLMAMGHAGHMINRLERSHAGGYDIYPPNVLKAAGAYVEKPGDNHGQCFAPYKRPATAKWYQSMNDERAQYVKEQEARPEVKRCKEALMAYNQADGKKPGFKFNVKKDIDGEYEVVNELGKDVLVAEASRKSDLDDYRGQRELLLQKNPVLAADVFSGHGGWLEKMEVYEDGYKGAFHAHEMIQHDMRKYDRMSDQEREDELQKNFNQDMLKAIKEARESIKDRSDDYKRILKNDDNLSGLITVLKAPKDKRAQAVKDYVDHVNFTLNDADLIEELLMTADPASDPDLRVLRNAECRLQAFVFADKAGHEIRSWELNSAMILMTAGVGGMMAETGNAVLKGIASGMNAGFVIQDGFSIAEASKKCDVIRASIAGGGVKKDAKGVAHLVTTKDSSGKQLFEQFKECQDEEVSTAVMAGINLLAIGGFETHGFSKFFKKRAEMAKAVKAAQIEAIEQAKNDYVWKEMGGREDLQRRAEEVRANSAAHVERAEAAGVDAKNLVHDLKPGELERLKQTYPEVFAHFKGISKAERAADEMLAGEICKLLEEQGETKEMIAKKFEGWAEDWKKMGCLT